MTKDTRNTTLSGLTDDDIDFWQQRAAELGLITKVGAGRGLGSMSAAVRSVSRGDATLLLTKDYNALLAALRAVVDADDDTALELAKWGAYNLLQKYDEEDER